VKKFEGIIFDIDGTLTATNELIYATFNHVTKKYLNRTYTPKEITAFFGPTEDVIIKELIGSKYEEAMKYYHDFYESNHKKMVHVYDGIVELVKKLHQNEIRLSIYTGKGRRSSETTLKQIGLYDYFDMVVTGDDIKEHKPSPEGIEKFIKKFNLPPKKVLMIGDAPADIKAARATGIKIASVLWDAYAKDIVLKMESDYYFNTVDELRSFLIN